MKELKLVVRINEDGDVIDIASNIGQDVKIDIVFSEASFNHLAKEIKKKKLRKNEVTIDDYYK
jgi:hypothetical protein